MQPKIKFLKQQIRSVMLDCIQQRVTIFSNIVSTWVKGQSISNDFFYRVELGHEFNQSSHSYWQYHHNVKTTINHNQISTQLNFCMSWWTLNLCSHCLPTSLHKRFHNEDQLQRTLSKSKISNLTLWDQYYCPLEGQNNAQPTIKTWNHQSNQTQLLSAIFFCYRYPQRQTNLAINMQRRRAQNID